MEGREFGEHAHIWSIGCHLCVQVRAVCGSTYMLDQDEELWEKELPPAVEQLLSEARDPLADRSTRPSRCLLGCVVMQRLGQAGWWLFNYCMDSV